MPTTYTISDAQGALYILEATTCVEDPTGGVFVFYDADNAPTVPAAILRTDCGYTIDGPVTQGTLPTPIRNKIVWITCDAGRKTNRIVADLVDAVHPVGTATFYDGTTVVTSITQTPTTAIIRTDCLICRHPR